MNLLSFVSKASAYSAGNAERHWHDEERLGTGVRADLVKTAGGSSSKSRAPAAQEMERRMFKGSKPSTGKGSKPAKAASRPQFRNPFVGMS